MAAHLTWVRLVFRAAVTCTLCWVLSLGAGALLPPPSASAGPLTIVLDLFNPEYGACGDVPVNGSVNTDSGAITRMAWDWGDGVVADSWFPAYHHYAADGTYLVQVTAYASTGDSLTKTVTAEVTNAVDPGCDFTLRIHPAVLLLRDGQTAGTLGLELRDGDGRLVSLAGRLVSFTSSNPTLVQVDGAGTITGTGFGEAQIEASVEGLPRHATARVVAGRFRVEPAIKLLSPAGEPAGALELVVADAAGEPVEVTAEE